MSRAASVICALLLAGYVGGVVRPGSAATSSPVVEVTVASSTTLDASGCGTGQSGRTDFGTVLPGSSRVTSLDCVIRFGSNNGPTTLQLSQFDRRGPAMHAPTTGERDASFSGDGSFSAAIGSGTAADLANVTVPMSDGQIAMVGTCDMGASWLDVCVVRMSPEGSLDTTFDGDGITTLALGPGSSRDYGGPAAEVAGGKLLIASQCYSGSTGLDHCLVRLLPDGSLDPTFGTGGVVLRDVTGYHEYVRGLHVLPGGSFLVGGDCEVGGPAGRQQCVTRYQPDGTVDGTFGSGGLATHLPAVPGPVHDSQLLVDANGFILVASACYVGAATDFDFCVTRFRPDGTVDATFGSGGTSLTAVSSAYDKASSIIELGDGRLLVSGHCDMGGTTGIDACIVRYMPDGTLDPTFGTAGITTIAASPGTGTDGSASLIHIAPDAYLFTGSCNDPTTGSDLCAYQVTSSGALDATFGTGGIARHPVAAAGGVDTARHASVLGDGKVVLAGGCDMPSTGQDLCAIVLDAAGHVDQYQPGTADWSTTDTSHFAACLLSSGTSFAIWSTSAACPASNGTFWNAVPAAANAVASAPSGTTNASAAFRFGLRTAPSQPPGSYVAPIDFTVAAP